MEVKLAVARTSQMSEAGTIEPIYTEDRRAKIAGMRVEAVEEMSETVTKVIMDNGKEFLIMKSYDDTVSEVKSEGGL